MNEIAPGSPWLLNPIGTTIPGTGPFKLRSWDIGSGLVVEAFADYIPGRPAIDVVEIRYLTDDNALIAGVLSGAIDVVLGAHSRADLRRSPGALQHATYLALEERQQLHEHR